MSDRDNWRPNLDFYGVPKEDPGWIYVVRSGDYVKVGKTTDPRRRLLREANTWSPEPLDIVGVKPFWNIRRIEYSLHTALAEHWFRGEWHKFTDAYWKELFLDAFREFSDKNRDINSIDFAYWMSGTNYVEVISMQLQHKMSLHAWRRCHGDPWHHLRPATSVHS